MSIQDWGAVGEIVGGFAVVITLIYLSVQLRQTSNSLQAAAMNTSSEANVRVMHEIITHPELVDLLMKGAREGLGGLTANERIRFVNWYNASMRFFENHYMMYLANGLPPKAWDNDERGIAELLKSNGAQEAWDTQKHVFSDDFVERVDVILRSHRVPG